MSTEEELQASTNEINQYLSNKGHRPKIFSWNNFFYFFNSMPENLKLIIREPEILVFVGFQFFVICFSYLLWTQGILMIPDAVWQEAINKKGEHTGLFYAYNFLFLVWSVLIVSMASYPIGICNAAICVAHNLKLVGEKSTIGRCLGIAFNHAGKIWTYTSTDAWITVSMILNRLPRRNSSYSITDELAYYAWKISSMFVIPSLVNGHGVIDSGKDALTILKTNPIRMLSTRFSYSLLCWIVGVVAYIAGQFFIPGPDAYSTEAQRIFKFYFYVFPPICIATGVVTVILRPFYFLSVCNIYSDLIDVTEETKKNVADPNLTPWTIIFSWYGLLFLIMLSILISMALFGDVLGLVDFYNRHFG